MIFTTMRCILENVSKKLDAAPYLNDTRRPVKYGIRKTIV